MEKRLRSKWLLYTGAIVMIIVLIIGYISYDQTGLIDYKQVSAIFLGGFLLFGSVIGIAFNSNQVIKVSDIKKDVSILNNKVDNIELQVTELDLKQAKADKNLFFVTEAFKHIKEIDNLCLKINNSASETLNGKHDLNPNFKNLVIQINDDVGTVIKKQYERGFDNFNARTFKTIILNHIKLSVSNSLVDNELKEVLYTPIFDRTRDYIEKIKLIANTENGIRRKKFIQNTLLYTNTLTNLSIDIYNKQIA